MSTEEEFIDTLKGYVGSGLPDDFDGTIANFRFAYKPEIQDGDLLVAICDLVTSDSDIGENGVIEEHVFKIGQGWATEDKGASIVREDGKKPKLNDSTALGKLVNGPEGLLKQDTFLKAVQARYRDKITFSPVEAGFYEGITGHWTRHEDSFTPKDGGPISFSWYTVEFTGYGAGTKASSKASAAPAAKKAAAPAKKAAKKAAAKTEATEATEDAAPAENPLKAQVEAIAREVLADDNNGAFDDFLVRVYEEVPGASDDAEIVELVEDDTAGGMFYTLAVEYGWEFPG